MGVKRTTVVSGRHRLTKKVKVGQKDLYRQEDYSCVKSTLSCVKRTLSHQRGDSWPKGFVCSRRLQLCQDDTLSNGKKNVPKDLYCQKDYSCVKGSPLHQTSD